MIRGPTVFMGYAKHNGEPFLDKDGYFATGDVCYCDEATKKWYIVDRKKVSPAQMSAYDNKENLDSGVLNIGFDQGQWISSCASRTRGSAAHSP